MRKAENKIIRRRMASAWISMLISISLVLMLVGVATLLLVNARSISDYFRERVTVSVVLKTEVSDAVAEAFGKELASMDFVKEAQPVSREQGTAEMAALLGEDFLTAFEDTPVPVSVDLTLKPEYISKEQLESVKARISASPLVDEVVYQSSLIEALNENLNKISIVLAILTVLLLFISFVLISNMVRLNVFSRRFTIHTMQLVGATRGFIRAPFVAQSAVQGLFAALVAIGLLVAGLFLLRKEFVQLFEIFRLDSLLVTMGIVIVSGVLICMVSTWIVVGRLVRYDRNQLYAI